MALKIRAPEEFSDVGVSNNFRPTSVDASAATSFAREAKSSLREIGQIVDTAHDNALRSRALADSVEYETRLTSLQAEMANEAPPEGVETVDWASTYAQRWQQRSEQIRQDVSRRRGRRSNAYLRYFDERANQIAGREQQSAIERGQAQIVDIDRAAGVEMLATFAAGSMNPDLPETAEGDAPSRARYMQQYIDYARERAREGTWSHQFAAERITQLQSERQTFLETEGRFQRARENADRIRAMHPGDVQAQLDEADKIENAREREQSVAFIMSDTSQEAAALQQRRADAYSRISTLVNRHREAWRRYATPEDIATIEADLGGMAQIEAQLDNLINPGGGSAQARGVQSARYRALMEDFGNSADPVVGAAFGGLDLDAPLTETDAAIMRGAGFSNVQEGDVLSTALQREDYNAILALQRERRSGVQANGDLVVDREVGDVVGYVIANGLADFSSDDDSDARRTNQQLFRAFVSQIIRDDFTRGGARDLSPGEVAGIARLAMSRAQANSDQQNRTPMYRRRNTNTVPYNQIPAATALRLRNAIPTAQLAGRTPAQIDEMVVQAYAEENRLRAQGR